MERHDYLDHVVELGLTGLAVLVVLILPNRLLMPLDLPLRTYTQTDHTDGKRFWLIIKFMLLKRSEQLEFEITPPSRHRGKENLSLNARVPKSPYTSTLAISCKPKTFLPNDLFLRILLFLSPRDINAKIKLLSRLYAKTIDSSFWKLYNQFNPLRFPDLYTKTRLIIERRGKGRLFEVHNKLTSQSYTLKQVDTLRANADCHDGIQTSLLREISYLKTLPAHPHVNPILEIYLQNHLVSILYDKHPLNLKDKLKHPLPFANMQTYFSQLAQAVHHLHLHHLMHRNLKPDNILFSHTNTLKLHDFALSRLETFPMIAYTPEDPKERERSNREIHRLWYRAPEMLFRKQYYGQEIDIWSVGCILAEMALGHPLFKGKSEIDYLFQVFALLGSPLRFDWDHIADQKEVQIKFPAWKQYSFDFTQLTEQQLKEFKSHRPLAYENLSKLNQKLGPIGMDLLQRCLNMRPTFRPTIEEVLQHPFLGVTCPIRPMGVSAELAFSNYFDTLQTEINQTMRTTLVDWLMDVATHFDLLDETLHLAVCYLDLALGKIPATKNTLQLIGVTCLKMADVYNEVSKEYYRQENCKAYAYITADEYEAGQIIETERQLLEVLGFRLTYKTALHYFRMMSAQLKVGEDIRSIGEFFVDFFLMTYDQTRLDRKKYAWCCLLLAASSLHLENFSSKGLCDCQAEELADGLKILQQCWQLIKMRPQTDLLDACMQRHSVIEPRNVAFFMPTNDQIAHFITK